MFRGVLGGGGFGGGWGGDGVDRVQRAVWWLLTLTCSDFEFKLKALTCVVVRGLP